MILLLYQLILFFQLLLLLSNETLLFINSPLLYHDLLLLLTLLLEILDLTNKLMPTILNIYIAPYLFLILIISTRIVSVARLLKSLTHISIQIIDTADIIDPILLLTINNPHIIDIIIEITNMFTLWVVAFSLMEMITNLLGWELITNSYFIILLTSSLFLFLLIDTDTTVFGFLL